MRPDDDSDRTSEGSLAEGVSDVSPDPYGEDSFDEDASYEDEPYGEGSSEDEPYGGESSDDQPYEDELDGDEGSDGTFGDGSTDPDGGGDVLSGDTDVEMVGQDNDPLEGVGYLLDELRDALLGEDDPGGLAGSSPLDADPLDADPLDVAADAHLDLDDHGTLGAHQAHEPSPLDHGLDLTDG